MRLVERQQDGRFELTRNLIEGDDIPRYAILSHMWFKEGQDVTFDDMVRQQGAHKAEGYKKIQFCGERAARDGLDHFWVDSCCIDRSNTAELQEAITSMFEWYRKADKCYAYLSDVSVTKDEVDQSPTYQSWEAKFCQSRWFTRGWTLQELLAPTSVEFFSVQGTLLGDKVSLQQDIRKVTGIPYSALQGEPLANFTIAERKSWAQGRQTTRTEDKAYSLLGIFSVFMVPNYGEGDHALVRLQDKIDQKHAGKGKLDDLLEKLPTSPSAAFNSRENEHEPLCLQTTRVELLEQIADWANASNDRSIFWLNGIAGTGKSTIARTVARDHYRAGNLGASFFFSKGGGEASQAARLFPTIAWQLADSIPSAKRHICEAIRAHSDITQKSLRDQWEQLVIGPLAKTAIDERKRSIVLVLDALDECGSDRDIETILGLLATTKSLQHLGLRIFITSRPETPVRCGFSEIPESERRGFVLHEISATLINRDLTLFFEDNLTRFGKARGFDPSWPGARLVSKLVESSYGLFIWASTACMYIRDGRAAAKERTNKLAQGEPSKAGPHKHLDKLYTQVLKDAMPQGEHDEDGERDEEEKAAIHDRLRRIVGAIVILNDRLSVHALANLLKIELELVKDTLADLHTILHVPSDSHRTIRLHHPTFRDFLLDSNRCNDQDFWIDEKQAQKSLANNCIRLMSRTLRRNICNLAAPGTSIASIGHARIRQSVPPELEYACLQWVEHYRLSGMRLQDDDEVHRFFKEHFLHWAEALCLLQCGSQMTAIIRLYQSLLRPGVNSKQLPFVKDSRRLLFTFQSTALQTPLQLYCAALAYTRPSNELRRHFWKELHPWLKVVQIVQADAPEVKDEYNYVNDLAFTPDGRKIASGSLDDWARVWDVSTLTDEAKFAGQSDKISSVSISPDGNTLASGSDDFTVMAWNMKTKETRFALEAHSRWVNSVTFSPDGKLLASGSMDETVRLWDASSGEQRNMLEPHLSGINCVSFSPDSRLLAIGAVEPIIHISDLETNKTNIRLSGHSGPVNSVQFSRDGKYLVSGSDDTTVRLWNPSTGEEVRSMTGHDQKVWCVVFAQSMPLIASGSEDRTIKLWDANKGEVLCTLKGHTSGVSAVAFSPDDKILAAAAFNDEVRFWHARTGDMQGKLADFEDDHNAADLATHIDALEHQLGHTDSVTCLGFSPDGSVVASGSKDGSIKVWSSVGHELSTLRGHSGGINHLKFSPTGKLLASASVDQSVRVWDHQSGDLLHTLTGHTGAARQAHFSPDETILASCSTDKTIILWNVKTGQEYKRLEDHSDTVNSFAYSLDNQHIASCSSDMTICVWEVATSMLKHKWHEAHEASITNVSFSNDGALLVSCSSDKTVKVWHVDGELYRTLEEHTLPTTSATFSKDNEQIVSSSADGTVKIWNVHNARTERTIETHGVLHSVAFSDCGRYIDTDRGLLHIKTGNTSERLMSTDTAETTAKSEQESARDSEFANNSHTNLSETNGHFREDETKEESSERKFEQVHPAEKHVNDIDGNSDHSTTSEQEHLLNKEEHSSNTYVMEHNNHEHKEKVPDIAALFVTEEWVSRDQEHALWLHDDFRANCVARWNDTVVIGHSSGALSFVTL